MKKTFEDRARGLNHYMAGYLQEVVMPFHENTVREQSQMTIPDQYLIFSAAAFMTFKMVDEVGRKSGVELPYLGSGLYRNLTRDTVIPSDPEVPLIDYHYRGSKLKNKLPHVYRPVLRLMQQMTGEEPEALDADLSMSVRDHQSMGMKRAMDELHFLGGAAETVLAIEELAPEDQRSPIRRLGERLVPRF